MASSDEGYADPFDGIHEPFAGLSEMDFELHGIYMDHEPEEEFLSSLDKCKDIFLNVLLSDENLRNSSMADEIRAQVYHAIDWQSDEDEHEVLKNNYRIHDPTIQWDKTVPKLGDIFESPAQLKFCVTNYAVSHGYRIYFEKCDSKRIVARCDNRKEENKCPFRIYDAWMFWLIIHSQQHVFEARRGCDSYMVDLDGSHCTCRLWDLAGISCVHVIATINYIQQTLDEYIDHMFSKEQFLKCYSANISPVNGSNLWPQTEFIKPLPPVSMRMPGRPKVNRRRHVTENDGRVHTPRTVSCGKCFEYGHNQRGCKNATREPVPMPPKKKGRPRKEQCEPSQASCDRSERQEHVPMPPKKKGRPRKKVQYDTNQASGSKSVRSKKKLGIKRGGGIVEDRVLLDEHDGLDGHVKGRGCEEQMKDLFDKEDIDDDSLVDMMCTFEASLSQPKYNYKKGD
ncbi:unnamed protein product [Lactuca virosa]|uniref:SWIM-type domain-containing protein n=1 Tax=Lactuca virosa TaxID=75947 RepID=A0AAU9NQU6_9ASTR|nr:unnamed protein product [Lactuca virosa]